jgi:hypothetical protein
MGADCFVDQIAGLNRTARLRLKRVGAAFGFFVAFALLHVVRSCVRASIKTLFVSFYELPEQMAQYAPKADTNIRKEYEEAVQRKRVMASHCSEVALLSRETLG